MGILEIPLDEEDWRYHKSFSVDQVERGDAADFFNVYGFVIVRDAYSDSEALLQDMITYLQEQDESVQRDDPATWPLTRFGMPVGAKAMFRPSLLRLRQDESVCRAFAAVLGLHHQEIVCNHDRWLLHRPAGNHKEWESPRNVHLDLNPFIVDDTKHQSKVRQRLSSLRYSKPDLGDFISENNDVHSSMGTSVQGLLNLRDLPLGRNGGGTIVVPGSHVPGQWPTLRTDGRAEGAMQYRIEKHLADQAQNVAIRAGSLLIWNQRLIHGSTPNMRRNMKALRAAVPIRFFHKDLLKDQKERAKSRAATISRELRRNGFQDDLSDLGRSVFGLDLM